MSEQTNSSAALDHALELARQHCDGTVVEAQHQQQKERLLSTLAAPPQRAGWYLAFAAVCLIGAALWWFAQPQPLQVAIRGGDAANVFALQQAQEQPVELQFDDGSQIQLTRGASGRLLQLGPRGALLELQNGVALVRIVPRSKARWRLRAGPYEVLVTGTAFSLEWHPEQAALRIEMERGSVRVRGGATADGISLQAGQRLVAQGESMKVRSMVDGSAALPTDSAQAVAATPAVSAQPVVNAQSIATAKPTSSAASRKTPSNPGVTSRASAAGGAPTAARSQRRVSWAALVARGAFVEVVNQAERRGTVAIMKTASVGELGALADAARYLKRYDLARQALSAQRARFAGSSSARAAAFILGTMADAAGNSAEALSFYQAYLAEGGGPFSREALGRALLAGKRSGQAEQTQQLAKQYLVSYPGGPHAKTAKRILGTSARPAPSAPRDASQNKP